MTNLIEEAQAQEEFFNPKTLTDAENEMICTGLEALFAGVTKPDKYEFPVELSTLLSNVVGENRLMLVINAGDGSTVRHFSTANTFGIEQDEKLARKREGSYHALAGDVEKLMKLLQPLKYDFNDAIIVLREGGMSAEKSLELAQSLREGDKDAYLFVLDHGNSNAEWLRANLPGLYAKIELTDEDTQLYLAAHPEKTQLPADSDLPTRPATKDVLDLLDPWVGEQRKAAQTSPYIHWYRTRDNYTAREIVDGFKAVQREYGRRFVAEAIKHYDVSLIARKMVDWNPHDWAKRVLDRMNRGDLNHINKRPREWFAQNRGVYDELSILEDKGILLIDPLFHLYVAPVVEAAKRATTPLRTPRPQERIGHLDLASEIKCIEDDEEKGLKAGTWYRVSVRQEGYEKHRSGPKPNKKAGGVDIARYKRAYRRQRVIIDNRHSFYDDDAEHLKYLMRHFAIPDPGDVKTKYPALYDAEVEALKAIEEKFLAPRGVRLKGYQMDDLARIGMKGRAVLGHEQGMGKTIEGLAHIFAERHKSDKNLPALIIAPQDLIPQWQAEAKARFGVELTWIGRHKGGGRFSEQREDGPATGSVKNIIEAKGIAKKLRVSPFAEDTIYITHFEALTGGKNHLKVEEPYTVRVYQKTKEIKPGWRNDPETGEKKYFGWEFENIDVEVSSVKECPCGQELEGALTCRKCGHTRVVYKLPTIGSILSGAFRKGVIVVDEGTQIASARNSNEQTSSGKTKAVAGLKARNRLVMSGTPIKNFISQAFWLLWWSIGNKSERFPYAYDGGKSEFAEDFSVWEWELNEETGNWTNKKQVGETTNPGRLWAQLGSVLLRRTKDETGELIVQKRTHVIEVARGYRQREQEQSWMDHFPTFYKEKHPDNPLAKRDVEIIKSMAPMLGLDVKLNYAAVLPKADQDWEWTGVPVSNYTPVALKTLETVMSLVKQGRRVLIGTDIKHASGWLAAELASKGIRVSTMLDNSGNTIDPPKRSAVVQEFQTGKVEIISSTIKAIRLGHNLDKGSAVVFFGLTWDYEEFSQFRDRVHRLTSERPVDVYVIIPGEKNSSIVGRKWEVITDKSKGAALALDGLLPELSEVPVEEIKAESLRKLMESGIPITGSEVNEAELETRWLETPNIEEFVIPDDFTKGQAVEWIIDWDAANAALAEYVAEQDEIEAQREHAELVVLHEQAITEDEQRTFAWEIVLDWAYAEDEAFIPVTLAPVEPEPIIEEPLRSVDAPVAVPDVPVSAPSLTVDLIGQLKELKELHDLGVLDEDEFKAAKGAVIASMRQPSSTASVKSTEGEPQLALAI